MGCVLNLNFGEKKFKNLCIKILELNIEKGIFICIIFDRIKYLYKN